MDNRDRPAYPMPIAFKYEKGNLSVVFEDGLTKREYFALGALQGILVNSGRNGTRFDDAADEAVRQADKLIEALNE